MKLELSTNLLLVFTVMKTGNPVYLANKLEIIREAEMAVRGLGGLRGLGGPTARVPNHHLDVSRAGFIYRGAKLFNRLPRILREETRSEVLKAQMKHRVRRNLSIKPS